MRPPPHRVAVVLYDGFQPLSAGPGVQVTASTGRRAVVTQAPTTAGARVNMTRPLCTMMSAVAVTVIHLLTV